MAPALALVLAVPGELEAAEPPAHVRAFRELRESFEKQLAKASTELDKDSDDSKAALLAAREAWLRALERELTETRAALVELKSGDSKPDDAKPGDSTATGTDGAEAASRRESLARHLDQVSLLHLKVLLGLGRLEQADIAGAVMEERGRAIGPLRRLLAADARGRGAARQVELLARFLTSLGRWPTKPAAPVVETLGRVLICDSRDPATARTVNALRATRSAGELRILDLNPEPITGATPLADPARLKRELGLGVLPLVLEFGAKGRLTAVDPEPGVALTPAPTPSDSKDGTAPAAGSGRSERE